MLMRYEGGHKYAGFGEMRERIAVRTVALLDEGPTSRRGLFDERPESVRTRQQAKHKRGIFDFRTAADDNAIRTEIESTSRDLAHDYMVEQLREYRAMGSDAIYDTVRFDGTRSDTKGNPVCQVSVFELYWADLARGTFGVLQGFVELYQILFYLCSLGRKTIDMARALYSSSWLWRLFSWSQALAERLLVLVIPIVNVYLLALTTVLVPVLALPENGNLKLCVLLTLGTILAVGGAIWIARLKTQGAWWPLWFAFVAGCASLVAVGLMLLKWDSLDWVSILWFPLPAFGAWKLFQIYEKRRRGAIFVSTVTALGILIALLVGIAWRHSHYSGEIQQAGMLRILFWIGELLFVCLYWSWVLTLCCAVIASITGFLAVRWASPAADRQACRRAAWTGNLTLILPVMLILILNPAIWAAILQAGLKFVPLNLNPPVGEVLTRPFPVNEIFQNGIQLTLRDAIKYLLQSSSQFIFLIELVLLIAGLWSAWSLLPAVFVDLKPPTPSAGSVNVQQQRSKWLGDSLSAAYGLSLKYAGQLVRCFLITGFLFLLCGQFLLWPEYGFRKWLIRSVGIDAHVLDRISEVGLGAVVIGIMLLVSSSQGLFTFVALGFRTVIDIGLDITGWLRLLPADNNPRARISARYVSLLRRLARPVESGRPDGGYDAIVILAHSQGTVVSADLLRFLQREHSTNKNKYEKLDPELKRIFDPSSLPMYFMSFGCPLRQLYNLRFPHLYSWVREDAHRWPNPKPAVADLGVQAWLNGYRSGDYLGRYLWFCDEDEARWLVNPADPKKDDKRVEFCLGEGAHLHYFDDNASDVARWTDLVIDAAGRW
jgi:hypothetical protein